MRYVLLAVCLTLLPAQVCAADDARDVYARGDFLAAATQAEAEGGSDNLALAARALLAEAVTGAPRNLDALLTRAEKNARGALAADASNTDARLQLAVAIGMKGRRASVAEAMRRGYAREGKTLVRAALRAQPREAWAHALEGGWNLEIVRRGGSVGASYFGASVPAGRAAFERARALAPDDALIAYQYAVALLELDPRRNTAEAAKLLEIAGTCRAGDAFEQRVQARARDVAAALKDSGADAAIRLATRGFMRVAEAPATHPM